MTGQIFIGATRIPMAKWRLSLEDALPVASLPA